MRAEELAELVRKQPFMPLRIHLTNGTEYEVFHPDQIIVMQQRVDIGVKPDRSTGVVERVDHCSMLHIVRVEELTAGTRHENN